MTVKKQNLDEAFVYRNECPVCGSSEKRVLYTNLVHTCNVLKKSGINISNEELPADIYECENCKHRYLSVVIADNFIRKYYGVAGSEFYDLIKDNPYDRTPKLTALLVQTLKRESPPNSSILEIGSGTGHFLNELNKAGYKCFGVEPNEYISEYSKSKFNLNIKTGLLDVNTFPENKFDMIVLNDVIEHIYEVNALFELVNFYLNPGGKILVLTGNSRSLYAKFCGIKWEYYCSWEHISFFNKNSIDFLFKRHNLSMVSFETIGHSGDFWWEVKVWFYTIRGMIANFMGFRNHKYFYMAFDHFIAIARK